MTDTQPGRRFMPDIADNLPPGQRPMIAVLRAKPGHEQQMVAATTALAAAVRREPGCVEFRAFRDLADPATFYLYEIYTDTDAFRVHLSTTHVTQFFGELEKHSTSDATALVQLDDLDA